MSIRKREKIYALLCLFFTLFWCVTYFLNYWFGGPLLEQEQASQNLRSSHGRMAAVDDRLIFLGLDKQSYIEDLWPDEIESSPALRLMTEKKYPWPRTVWALLAERLIQNGARLIVFDFMFPNASPSDNAFHEVIAAHPDKIILGADIGGREISSNTGGAAIKIINPNESIIGELQPNDPRVGLVNFWVDSDRTVRRLCFNYTLADQKIPTILHRVVERIVPDHPLLNSPKTFLFRFAGPPQSGFKFHPIYEIFSPSLWKANYDEGKRFKGKIVLVGPAASWTQDTHKTPFDDVMFGPELHLNAINAVLQDELVDTSSLAQSLLIIFLSGVLAFVIFKFLTIPLKQTLALLMITLCYLAICWVAYNRFSFMLLLLTPILCLNSCGAACLVYQFILEGIERAKTRSNFEQYVSKNVVKLMLDSPDFKEVLKGVRRPCTILFSDIRGFTTISEKSDSHALVSQLNEYFGEMVDCVFEHNGTLDKFIGDAVMAVWGNATTRGPKQDAIDAVNSALEMLKALKKLNQKWMGEGNRELAIGIGINHGEVIVGDMGSPTKKEFTVIGDAVNLASRIEGTTKQYGLQLIIGEHAAELVKDHFFLQKVDMIQVKGKTHPVQTYTVLGSREEALPKEIMLGLRIYHEGIEAFLQRQFSPAEKKFSEAKLLLKDKSLPELYLKRSQAMEKNPPDGDWNGVVILTEK